MWAGTAAGVQSSEKVGYTELSTSDSLQLGIFNESLKFSRPRCLNQMEYRVENIMLSLTLEQHRIMDQDTCYRGDRSLPPS